MFSPYRRVLGVPGAWQFSLAGFVGRLPISMVSLGIVLLVSRASGSYGAAGTVVAAFLLANALCAILLGRALDRFGQSRVLPLAQTVFTLALVLLMWGVEQGWHPLLVHAAAALAGGSLPQLGACVRARWSHVLDSATDKQTAYALEGVVDEALFVLGPTAVTVLATAWHPVAGLVTALVCGLVGTLAFVAQRGTEPPPHPRRQEPSDRPAMPWGTVVPLALVCVSLGAVFGATEVVTVAFTEERGVQHLAGPLLGLWALGSLSAGLVTGAIAWRSGPEVRVRWGILALGLTLVPLTFVDSLVTMAVLLLLGGMAIAPTLIATLTLTERTVPTARLTEGMAVLHTAMGIGIAPGATVAGFAVDAAGASAAYVVPAAAGLLGALAAWTTRTRQVRTAVPSGT